MWRMFSLNGNYIWIDKINDLLDVYNNRVHRTINMRPIDVRKKHEAHILNTAYNYNEKAVKKTKFNVNDYCRISKYKQTFEKGYTPNWGTEIFQIVKVHRDNPQYYHLVDYLGEPIKGCFYAQELQKVKHPDGYLIEKVIKRKGDKAYVKFLGFSDEHNSWVDASTII